MGKKVIIGLIIAAAATAVAAKVIKDILDADRQEKEVISLEEQESRQTLKKSKH